MRPRLQPLAMLALLMPFGLGTGQAAEPAVLVEMFQKGCLDHLPDFAGSEAALKELGFEAKNDRLETDAHGGTMYVELGVPPDGAGEHFCLLTGETNFDPAISDHLKAAVASIVGEGFEHRLVAADGIHADRISWVQDGKQVRVVLEMFSTGEAFAGAVVAEAGN